MLYSFFLSLRIYNTSRRKALSLPLPFSTCTFGLVRGDRFVGQGVPKDPTKLTMKSMRFSSPRSSPFHLYLWSLTPSHIYVSVCLWLSTSAPRFPFCAPCSPRGVYSLFMMGLCVGGSGMVWLCACVIISLYFCSSFSLTLCVLLLLSFSLPLPFPFSLSLSLCSLLLSLSACLFTLCVLCYLLGGACVLL